MYDGGMDKPASKPVKPVDKPVKKVAKKAVAKPVPAVAPSTKPRWRGMIESGAYGVDVLWLRERLGLPAGKRFDKDVMAAVGKFQAENGLRSTGRVDKATWAKL